MRHAFPFNPDTTLLVVTAHPDDETLNAGGTIARCSAAGMRTVVVSMTGGESGRRTDTSLVSGRSLGEVRLRELRVAGVVLGASKCLSLGFADSGLPGSPASQASDALVAADHTSAVERLVRTIREERPAVIITHDALGGYGHPDHRATHRITFTAFEAAGNAARCPDVGHAWSPARLYAAVFPRSLVQRFVHACRAAGLTLRGSAIAGADVGYEDPMFGLPDQEVSTTVDVRDYVDLKFQALSAHRTQFGPDHYLMRLSRAQLSDLWSTEFFLRLDAPDSYA
jgi:LmbE family N-acetylglucosaminyl deacetylase